MRIIFNIDGLYSTLSSTLSSITFAWKQISFAWEQIFGAKSMNLLVSAHLCDDFLIWQLKSLEVYFQKRGIKESLPSPSNENKIVSTLNCLLSQLIWNELYCLISQLQ